jgi:cytochrome c-type biogenesis protein
MQTTNDVKPRPSGVTYFFYVGLMGLMLVIIGLGYLGFRQFAGVIMPHMEAYNLLALAVIAGVASFFSPCAFPLLPGYLSFYSGIEGHKTPTASIGRTLGLGLVAAGGVITFNLILGGIIGLLGASAAKSLSISGPTPNHWTLWFRGGVGLILIALGVGQWRGLNLKPHLADAFAWQTRPNREGQRPAATLYFYGLGYNAAGMGCTGPILAGLTVFALSSGGFNEALSAFLVFSATMGGLMALISGLVAASQDTLIRRLKASAPRIKQISSLLLVLVGMFNITTALNVGVFVQLLFP